MKRTIKGENKEKRNTQNLPLPLYPFYPIHSLNSYSPLLALHGNNQSKPLLNLIRKSVLLLTNLQDSATKPCTIPIQRDRNLTSKKTLTISTLKDLPSLQDLQSPFHSITIIEEKEKREKSQYRTRLKPNS
jgi:hypothetical protein